MSDETFLSYAISESIKECTIHIERIESAPENLIA